MHAATVRIGSRHLQPAGGSRCVMCFSNEPVSKGDYPATVQMGVCNSFCLLSHVHVHRAASCGNADVLPNKVLWSTLSAVGFISHKRCEMLS